MPCAGEAVLAMVIAALSADGALTFCPAPDVTIAGLIGHDVWVAPAPTTSYCSTPRRIAGSDILVHTCYRRDWIFSGIGLDMQPLSRFGTGIHCEFGESDIITSRPKVAVRIAECIAEWTEIETLMGLLLALLLDADAKAALAMYGATENRTTQQRMLTAAAQHKMRRDEYDVLEAILAVHIRPAAKDRDKLAHWCSGRSPKFPEALLLTPPTTKTALHHYALNAPSKPKLDSKSVFVVKDTDLGRMAKRFRRAKYCINGIIALVREKDARKRALVLQKLSNEPLIPEAVNRIRAGHEKN